MTQMKWYVIHTQHHHERAVSERLRQSGYEVYLPLARVCRQSKRGVREGIAPLFPGHVFVRCHLDMYSHLELITMPGVIRLPEHADGEFLVLSGAELRLLQRLCAVGLPVARAGYPRDGERVQVAQGPLQGVSGVLEQRQPLTLFVPIATLQTSVGVRIDGAQLIPCEVAQETPVSHLSWEV